MTFLGTVQLRDRIGRELPDLGGQLVVHLSWRGNKNGAYHRNAFEPHDDCVPPFHCGGEYRGG